MPFPPVFTDVWDITQPPDTQAANQLGLDIRNLKTDIMQRMSLLSGLLSNRPTPETVNATWGGSGFGIIYIATDTNQIFQWNGSAWVTISLTPTPSSQNFTDSTVFYFRDDFFGGTNISGSVGDHGWSTTFVTSGSPNFAKINNSVQPNSGQFDLITPATSGDGAVLYVNGLPLAPISSSLFDSTWVVSISTTANIAFRAGLMNGVGSDPPTDGMWIRFDTGASDAYYTWECRKSGASTLGSIAPPAVNTSFHHFRIRSTTAGTILFSIDGGTEQSCSTNVTALNLTPAFQVIARSAAVVYGIADFFAIQITGLSR